MKQLIQSNTAELDWGYLRERAKAEGILQMLNEIAEEADETG